MTREIWANILVSAGPRVMEADPQERPEYIARQDWAQTPEAMESFEEGIGFGFELKAPEKFPVDFNPKDLNGIPFGLHAGNEALTQLYKAEQEGNQQFIDEFWTRIELWVTWKPLYVNFHGADLATIPPMDEKRFNCLLSPEEWFDRALWHVGVFSKMIDLGLKQARLETLYLFSYYGPPYCKPDWLPLTYFAPRVGIYRDIVRICQKCGIMPVIDWEHLEATIKGLNGDTIEIRELQNSEFASCETNSDFRSFFGFCAEKDKICRAHPDEPVSWEEFTKYCETDVYHIGGINPQVMQLKSEESDTEYHKALAEQLKDNQYAWNLVKNRRGGSHASVDPENKRMMEMFDFVLKEVPLPPGQTYQFVIETADFREGKKPGENPGYWYLAEPDSMFKSMNRGRKILIDKKPK